MWREKMKNYYMKKYQDQDEISLPLQDVMKCERGWRISL